MCGRLLVGKSKRRVALLVGAALYALEGVLVGARSSSRVMMALRRELLGGKKVADWLLNLPVSWMALIVFVATYLIAGGVYLVVTKLALTEWARAFKAVSRSIQRLMRDASALLSASLP